MSDVLTAEEVEWQLQGHGWETAARLLARSHEQLRGERDAAKEQFWQQRHEWAAATGENQRIIDAALAKADAAVRAGGNAAELANAVAHEIATDLPHNCLLCSRPGHDHVEGCVAEAFIAAFAREALAALEPDEEKT